MRLRRVLAAAIALALSNVAAPAQWQILDAHTTASLRGVHNVGQGIVWASGTNGTVLRSIDDGKSWTTCTTPPDAEKLDFRGIQAFDADTAIVMSSGKGNLSRLFKTTDGCATWKLIFTNPDEDGFWDAIAFRDAEGRERGRVGYVVGDPVRNSFAEFITYDGGNNWTRIGPGVGSLGPAKSREALFAASNSSLQLIRNQAVIVTGGRKSRFRASVLHTKHDPVIYYSSYGGDIPFSLSPSSGAFSFAAKLGPPSVSAVDDARFIEKPTHNGDLLVAVGGDYLKPNDSTRTAALTTDGGLHWTAATTPPHGYRSAVAYYATTKTWITVGPNGTDISTDDGRNWQALKPDTKAGDAPDADQKWNALSLPFVVGPQGRIGKLRPDALHQPITHSTKNSQLETGDSKLNQTSSPVQPNKQRHLCN